MPIRVVRYRYEKKGNWRSVPPVGQLTIAYKDFPVEPPADAGPRKAGEVWGEEAGRFVWVSVAVDMPEELPYEDLDESKGSHSGFLADEWFLARYLRYRILPRP